MGEKEAGSLAEQGKEMAHNMAEVFDISRQIWKRFLEGHLQNGGPKHPDPLNTWPAFAELYRAMWDNPKQVADATIEYWWAQQQLWQNSMLKWLGAKDAAEPLDLPHMLKPDKRFSHKDWSENAVFDYIKQSYLLTSGWIQDTVASVGEMDPKERRKAAFYTRYFVEALNPANFFALNPEVLQTTLDEKGENLVRGLKMMLADLDRGKGKLLIRQTDMEAFEVGRNTAVSPGAVVFQNDLIQLIQYAPLTEKVHAKPLLVIPPWINKYYILDINPKKSLVKWLLEQGYTVFVISWVNPDERHGTKSWEDYMFEGGLTAIDKVLEETGQKSLNLASYCVGGTMAGTLMAWLGKTGDKRVASATFFTAQLDFQDAGELQIFVDEHILEVVGEDMEKGYMPAERMATAFNMLRSNDLIWGYVVNNYMLGKDPFPFDLLYWNADSTAMPARAHRFYLEQFYIRDAFAKGQFAVRGMPITLADISGPVYHVATKEDHIAPAASVYRGAKEMSGADVRFVLSGSGHIAGVVNPPALHKYQFWTNPDLSKPTLEDWLKDATETPGSWWPDWDVWLAKRSGRMVQAREPGARLGRLEPAPGSYVKVRFDQPDAPAALPIP
jgi:polyhydroxyalkanoate synthase